MKLRTTLYVVALVCAGPMVGGGGLISGLPVEWALALTASVASLLPVAVLLCERRRGEEQARQWEAYLQRLIDVIPEPVYVKDEHGHYLMVNEAFTKQLHSSRYAIIGRTASELVSELQTAARIAREDAEVLAGSKLYMNDSEPHPKTGEPRYRIATKGACLNALGKRVIVGANFDITRQRLGEAKLQASLEHQTKVAKQTREFIQNLIDTIPYPFYIRDSHSRFLWVNENFLDRYRRCREEVIGTTVLDLRGDEDPFAVKSFKEDRDVLNGLRIQKEEHVDQPGHGEPYHQIIIKSACAGPDGDPVIVGINIDVTQLRESEAGLAELLERERTQHSNTLKFVERVLDLLPYPIYVKDARSCYLLVNEAMVRDSGMSREELLERMGLSDGDGPEQLLALFEEDGRVLAGERILREQVCPHPHTGREVFRILSKGTCNDARGEPVIVGTSIDLTDLRLAEQELKISLERETALRERTLEFVQRLIDLIPDPVYVKKSGGLYVMINEAFVQYHNLPREVIMEGPNSMRYSRADVRKLSLSEDESILKGAEVSKEEHTIRQSTGEEVFRIVTKRRSTYFDGDPVIVGIDHHITRWRLAERELQRLASEDALTGLANRRKFREEASRAMALAARHQETLSLFLLDIDHFKRINDALGHNAGDEVLKETVRRCLDCLRSTDLLGRWGGEEFIALLPHTRQEEAQILAERLREGIAATPVRIGTHTLYLTVSGGYTQWTPEETLDAWVSRADAALYRAKKSGRNKILPA